MPGSGWYEDPDDAAQLRYWDGTRWSDERRARDVPPPPPPPFAPPSPPPFPPPFPPSAAVTSVPPTRTFPEAIQVCLRKYIDVAGRAARSEYWYFFLFTALAGAVASAISAQLETAVSIALFLPTVAVGARRLHDIGRSGWNQLWWILPIIGWIIIIVRLTRVGDPGPNAYG